MTQGTPPRPGRRARQRLRTRKRLIDAARRIIAERGGIDLVPIAEITEEADVAIGSFYNHFASREALFEAVVTDTLEAHGHKLDVLASEIADVAEFCAAGIRLTLRMAEADPIWGGFMVRMGNYRPELGSILGRRFIDTLLRGIHSGRFTVADEATALAVVAGAMSGAIHGRFDPILTDSLPADGDCLVAEMLLQLLGLPREEAAEIARLPLPESSEQPLPVSYEDGDVVAPGGRRRTS